MEVASQNFSVRAREALQNVELQRALGKARGGFVDKRRAAVEAFPDFQALRQQGEAIKNHTLEHLDYYLEQYEAAVIKAGGQVHWARDAKEATAIVLDIIAKAGGTTVTKGKSMVGEEVAVNEAMEAAGLKVIETDLGEYIIQLAKEPPSHIIAPAVHKTKDQISDLFHEHHQQYGLTERLTGIADLVNEARTVLRAGFLSADIGITGANFLIAESGSNVIVTNEGNGDLTCSLPKVHIVTAGIEKVVPTLEDATTLLRLLGRSATGQEFTSYTTFSTGPKRSGDADGPEQYHVVLVDNGRTEMLASEFRPMLRCIRCGACMNHCPVYGSIGGHAYGWVYPGPMGSVLTPAIMGLEKTGQLPNACTLNGRCGEVCPMRIPLPDMLRALRSRLWQRNLVKGASRWGIGLWAALAKRPALYQRLTGLGMGLLGRLGRSRGSFRSLPGASGWTRFRDMPAPQGETFQSAWRRSQKEKSR